MKLTNFKIVPFMLTSFALLALNGCGGSTGTESDSALGGGVIPVAVNDTGVGVSGAAATISVVANDTDFENNLDVSSVQIVGTATPGDSLIVVNEGTWTVSVTGSVTFTPASGFTNDPSVISYTVSDTGGLISNEATVTIDYPQTAPVAVDDDAIGISGTATTINVLNNDTDAENDINASSIKIVGTTNSGDSLVVAGEGTWSISSSDRIVFTPDSGFTGDPTDTDYTVMDNTGLESNTATVSIDYPQTAPVANADDTNETTLGSAVTLNVVENDTDVEGDINASTVNFSDTAITDAINTDDDDDNDQLIVAGEGNWTVDEDGNVTFTPDASFTGDPTPIFYTVTDNTGLESNEANVTVDYPPALFTSCKAYLDAGLSVGDGNYTIDPDGPGGLDPFEVYCDMTGSDAGYTIKTVTNDTALFAPDAETYCSDNFGMQLFVPRTEAHLTNAVATYGAEYFFIMGIYPNYSGATCAYTPFNSSSCATWATKDNGVWYVSNRTDIAEPNGDNVVNHSMGYNFTGTSILNYNDFPTGYSSATFACSAIDDPLANAQSFVNNTPVVINHPGITTSTINVTGATTSISQMIVGLNMNLFFNTTSDLSITLMSPAGTTIVLSDNSAIPNNVVFGDAGPQVPDQPLSIFNNEDANGVWTLGIDSSGIPFFFPESIQSWSLTIEE